MKVSMTSKSTTPPVGTPDISQLATRIANGFMTNFDTNQDGSINKDEFIRGMTSKGISAEKAAAQFMAVDIKGKGVVTKQDIQTAVKNGAFAGGARGGRGGGGGGMRVQSSAKATGPSDVDAAALSDVTAVDSPQMATAEADVGKTKSATESEDAADAERGSTVATHSNSAYTAAQLSRPAAPAAYSRAVGSQVDRYV
jgi:hypothetical protein